MLYCNEKALTKFPELFIKNIVFSPNTTYRLTFDQLGGSIGVWINRSFATHGSKSHHFTTCREWTAREVIFTTMNDPHKLSSCKNWGIAFFKKNESRYMCGLEDSYIDNVQLTVLSEPDTPLLVGGDFDAPNGDAIYQNNWQALSFNHELIGVTEDPSDRNNRCLCFRSLMVSPAHPTTVPIQAHTFGHVKDPLFRITRHHLYGVPYHCLLFVERGVIVFEDTNTRVLPGNMVYIPPNTPFHYTFERHDANCYWVEFSGSEELSFLSDLEILPFSPLPVRLITTPIAHIEQMLQQSHDAVLYPYVVSSHLQLLLADLRQQLCTETKDDMQQRMELIATQLQQTSLLPSNKELAAENGFSTGYFIRTFKSYIGCTPHRYALQCRLENARTLLKTTPLSIAEIAYTVGFDDPQYFSRLFRADTGMSPRDYRRT